MAKFCGVCGNPLNEGAEFCPNCGKKQIKNAEQKFCGNCGTKMSKSANHCPNCGKAQNAELNAKFCGYCGTKMSKGANHCPGCGKAQNSGSPAQNNTDQNAQAASQQKLQKNMQRTQQQNVQRNQPQPNVPNNNIQKNNAQMASQQGNGQWPHQQMNMPAMSVQNVQGEAPLKGTKAIVKKIFHQDHLFGFLFASVFLFAGGKDIISTIQMMKTQEFLEPSRVTANWHISLALGMLFVLVSFLCMNSEVENIGWAGLRSFLALIPPFFALSVLYWVIARQLQTPVEEFSIRALIITIITGCIVFLLFLLSTFYAVAENMQRTRVGTIQVVFLPLKHPFKLFTWMVGWVLVLVLMTLTEYGCGLLLEQGTPTVPARWGMILAESIVASVMIRVILLSMKKNAGLWLGKREQARQYAGKSVSQNTSGWLGRRFSYAYIIMSGLLLAATVMLFFTGSKKEEENESSILTEIDLMTLSASIDLMQEHIAGAEIGFQKIKDRLDALQYYCEGNSYELERLVSGRGADDIVIWQCYLAQAEDGVSRFEQYVLKNSYYLDADYMDLLFYTYGQMKTKDMTKQEKNYQEELFQYFLANAHYTSALYSLPENDRDKEHLLKELEDYEYIRASAEALHQLNRAGKEGALNGNIVDEMQRIAEKYPEEWMVQYLAGMVTAGGAGDGMGSTYEGGIACIHRFLELSEQQKGISDEELLARRMKGVQMIIQMKGYEDALALIEEFNIDDKELKEQLEIFKLFVYMRDRDMEHLREETRKMMDAGNENPEILFYYGIASQECDDQQAMIDMMEKLMKEVMDSKNTGNDLYKTEQYLYILAECAIMNENGILGSNYFYQSWNEEQKQVLSKELYHYLEAMAGYVSGDYEKALEEIEMVLEGRKDLTFAWYLKGMIYYGAREFDDAIECYQKALESDDTNITFLYALANAYDGAGQYQEAYAASALVEELLPQKDHAEDPFGIGFHNPWLRERLENYVGGDN